LARYPTKGPLDGDALFFHGNRIVISGQKTSLNDLKQKVIRPTFQEPRTHFAINCASESCPPPSLPESWIQTSTNSRAHLSIRVAD
jgi:hypothetical protein